MHAIEGQNLMIRDGLSHVAALRTALRRALGRLEALDEKTPWTDLAASLSKLGFAPGWGDAAGSVVETMTLLMDILEAPSPAALEAFLARIPMVSRILIVSPHGYFSQANVLGRPDTGGQVIYILDQVRALEREMRDRMHRQGVSVEPQILILTRLLPEAAGTTCHEPVEKVIGTSAATILRVPFRRENGEIVPHWISRFEIWPYLERFARDAEREVLARFGSRPDLVIGNYSDGILVATLLSQRLGVTQCNVAHALEMTKYLHSSLYWRENEPRYHFSCQYTADLIGMNAADFIIASTYQEIAGTATTVGQYESYGSFTMPGLYRVVNGVDLLDPKFNIVSPGVDGEVYFPYREQERRLAAQQPLLQAMIWGTEPLPFARGALEDRQRPLLFTMARLDRIKNIAGFVDWYGASERLRGLANVLVVGGSVDANQSADDEEREQIGRMHELMDRHRLHGQVRWIGKRLDRNLAGEVYRLVADVRGAFVQPALFEAFGLTVVEAMASGLPTFATRYGGPSEIIEPGRSGFRIDPNDGPASAARIAAF